MKPEKNAVERENHYKGGMRPPPIPSTRYLGRKVPARPGLRGNGWPGAIGSVCDIRNPAPLTAAGLGGGRNEPQPRPAPPADATLVHHPGHGRGEQPFYLPAEADLVERVAVPVLAAPEGVLQVELL